MAPSMRKDMARRAKGDEEKAQNRAAAVELIRKGKTSLRDVSRITEVPKSTVHELSFCIKNEDHAKLNKLLHPESFHSGKQRVLTSVEEKMIVDRMIYAANRGFAFDIDDLQCMMARIAGDGRKSWANGLPSADNLRSFRARHPELTFRSHEKKDAAKLAAEDATHLRSFSEVLQEVQERNPGIFNDPSRMWNVDKTFVLTEVGKKIKVFASSMSKHRGFRKQQTGLGEGRHVTCLIAVSAAGQKAPPFFIVQGTKSIAFKLTCGVKAWEMITIGHVKSFEKTGTWPVDHNFIEFFPPRRGSNAADENGAPISDAANGNGMRTPDAETVEVMKNILTGNKDAALKIREFAIELRKAPTTNSILMSHSKPRPAPRQTERNYVVCSGGPAQLLTIGDALEGKKAQNEELATKKEAVAKRKAKALEKKAKKRKATQ